MKKLCGALFWLALIAAIPSLAGAQFFFPPPINASGTPTNQYNAVSNWSATKALTRTPGSNGSQQKFTLSLWAKKAANSQFATLFTSPQNFPGGATFNCGFGSLLSAADNFQCLVNGTPHSFITSNTFTSTTSWYHICVGVDTTQATAANRNIVTINGAGQTLTDVNYSLNDNVLINITTATVQVGTAAAVGSFNGKIAYITFVDGAQVACSSFEQTGTGGQVPLSYSGAYGTNGVQLKFANTSSLGADTSGNGNTYAVNSLTPSDASAENVVY